MPDVGSALGSTQWSAIELISARTSIIFPPMYLVGMHTKAFPPGGNFNADSVILALVINWSREKPTDFGFPVDPLVLACKTGVPRVQALMNSRVEDSNSVCGEILPSLMLLMGISLPLRDIDSCGYSGTTLQGLDILFETI